MFQKILHNPILWDSSRYLLDLTCGYYPKRKTFLKNLGVFRDNPSVLDIGCGTGLFGEVTEGPYVGVDIDCQSIQYAKTKRYKTKKTFKCIDINTLAKGKVLFDVALIVDVIHHLNDQECIDLLKASAKMTKKYLISLDPISKKGINIIEKGIRLCDQGKYFRNLTKFNALFQAGGYKIITFLDMPLGFLSTHFTLCTVRNP